MPVTVRKITLWRSEVDNKPGALASTIEPPTKAGADLKVIMGYRHPTAEGKATIEVFPITGNKVAAVAGAAGLAAAAIPTLLVEGDNKPGLGYAIAQMIAGGGINVAFLVAQVIGKEFAAVIGFETEEDAKKAAPLINWDASLCRAIVYLQGPAKLMPWTSSKSGINAGHPVFQRLRPTLIELVSHFTKLSRRLKNDWDEKVTPHATGRIEVITAADIAPGKRLNLPTLPRGNKQQVEHLKAQNKTVLKDAPWTLGLIEAIAAVDVIKRQRLDTKNRIHLGRADGPQLSPTIMVPD
jgi:hypothetical protein